MADLNILFPLTHAQLVRAAYEWVLKRGSCGVAFREFHTYACNGEHPDVIGFGSGSSTVIECKVSRADFFADAKKMFRRKPAEGMGDFRYYCCPNGLLTVTDLPEGWGLLYVDEAGKATRKHRAEIVKHLESGFVHKVPYQHKKNIRAEHGLMYSALRRLHLRNRIEEVYTDPSTIKTQQPMTQLHELLPNLYAFNVPMDAHHIGISKDKVWYCTGGMSVPGSDDVKSIPTGNWSIICCSATATEEEAGKVVEMAQEGAAKGYKDYQRPRIGWPFDTATESLASLIRSKGLDDKLNWLFLKLD